jgi:hypothetical protein
MTGIMAGSGEGIPRIGIPEKEVQANTGIVLLSAFLSI